MNKFIIALGLIALVSSLTPQEKEDQKAFKKFQKFIKKYNKHYSSIQEFMARFNIFRQSLNQPKKQWIIQKRSY